MLLATLPLLFGAPGAQVPLPAPPADEPTIEIDLVRNGTFTDPLASDRAPLPWWKVLAGEPRPAEDAKGPYLAMQSGDAITQPLAIGASAADSVRITLMTAGPIVVSPADGLGGTAGDVPLAGLLGNPTEFSFSMSDLQLALGRKVVPRLQLVLRCEGGPGSISDVRAVGRFPCPDEDALRAELVRTLRWSFGTYLERALDDSGPRSTSFVAFNVDADSGERIGEPFTRVTYHPLWGQLLEAWRHEPDPQWGAALERFLEDFLELGLHPATGLPRYHDPRTDTPLDDVSIEIRVHLEFLLDVAEHGPEAYRERALDAARRIGEQVLATGLLPDGSICARYVPSSGAAQPGTVPIRRLDVPAALARLGAITGDDRLRAAAVESVAELAYDHYWPGTWDRIDPGFDDNFGHYGERATAMWRAWPEEASFERLARSGLERYLPLWRDALRFGGNIAADQVRCWRIARDLAHLDPQLVPDVAAALDAAVWVHFTGQQASGGHWIDTTVVGFDPQRLPVGDTLGVPQNLLDGLAVAYDPTLGLDRDELRARYTAALRSTLATYGGPYGLIGTVRRAEGPNPAIGSLRLNPGLVEMLEQLTGE